MCRPRFVRGRGGGFQLAGLDRAGVREIPAHLPIARQAVADAGGDGGPTSQEILEHAQAEIDAEIAHAKQEIQSLIDSAGVLSKEEILRRELAITARIEALRVEIDIKIAGALNGKFPRMEAEYIGQINTLLGDVSARVVSVGGDLLRAWLSYRGNISGKTAVTSVVLDRVAALVAVASLVLLTAPRRRGAPKRTTRRFKTEVTMRSTSEAPPA